jgi:hypothetical protein
VARQDPRQLRDLVDGGAVLEGERVEVDGDDVQPRFIMRQAATGESIPPESSAATRPELPTGKPPAPGWRSNE